MRDKRENGTEQEKKVESVVYTCCHSKNKKKLYVILFNIVQHLDNRIDRLRYWIEDQVDNYDYRECHWVNLNHLNQIELLFMIEHWLIDFRTYIVQNKHIQNNVHVYNLIRHQNGHYLDNGNILKINFLISNESD